MDDYQPGYNHIYAFGFPAGNYGAEYVATGLDESAALENLGYAIRGSAFTAVHDEIYPGLEERFYPVNGGEFYVMIPLSVECLDGCIGRIQAELIESPIRMGIDQLGEPSMGGISGVTAGVDDDRPSYVRFTIAVRTRYGTLHLDVYKKPDNVRKGSRNWGFARAA